MLFLSLDIKLLAKDIFGIFLWAVRASCSPSVYILPFFLNHKILIFNWTALSKAKSKATFSASLVF